MTHLDFRCGLLLRNLLQQQKSVQPRQNAAATKHATNMAKGDRDDDVILIAGVLLSGAFVNECKKKAMILLCLKLLHPSVMSLPLQQVF